MRLFFDTSVLLAASVSKKGAAWFVIEQAEEQQWELFSCDYCAEEAKRNLPKLGRSALLNWQAGILPRLCWVSFSVALDRPLVFPKAKDRPVVITALSAKADWLLTLDETDFHGKLGREVYGLTLATPGEFLIEQRARGIL